MDFTASGNSPTFSPKNTDCRMGEKPWNSIPSEIIQKSFEVCRISIFDVDKIHCTKKGECCEKARERIFAQMNEEDFLEPEIIAEH